MVSRESIPAKHVSEGTLLATGEFWSAEGEDWVVDA
jgi:hypothetical protein